MKVKYGPARIRYERRKRRRQKLQALNGLWNALSIILGMATVVVAGYVIWRMSNSSSSVLANEIATATIERYDPIATSTLEPEIKPTFVKNEVTLIPTRPMPTVEDESLYTFDLQASPESISATLFRPDRTCNWAGIAGQAFDLQGRPIPGITVQVTGPMYGKDIQFLSITGSAPIYGLGGYEIFLTDKPSDTKGEYQIRLVDQNGRGLSKRFSFDTSSDCSKNLVIVNFRQIK